MTSEVSSSGHLFDEATFIAVTAALIYVAGWAYAYHYFGHFQVGLLGLTIPREYYFLYGFWVVRDSWWLATVYLIVASLLPWTRTARVISFLTPMRTALRGLSPIIVLVLVVVVYRIGVSTADRHYLNQADLGFPAYAQTRVWMKPSAVETDSLLQRLRQALLQGCYRLLIRDDDKLLLFRPPRGATITQLALVDVPVHSIEAIRVLPEYGQCEE